MGPPNNPGCPKNSVKKSRGALTSAPSTNSPQKWPGFSKPALRETKCFHKPLIRKAGYILLRGGYVREGGYVG